MSSCPTINAFGFYIDFCTWNWSWSLATQSSILFHVGICIFYAVLVKLLQIWVASQPSFKLPKWFESFRKAHNLLLSITSLLMGVAMIYATYMDGRYSSWKAAACQMTPMSGIYGFANFVYLVSKIWEWVDTFILVVTKKHVITLHWFHHMTTFTMAALTHNFPVGGFAWLNCLIHTVMYLHYYSPVRWARPFITSGQLIQFVIVLTIHVYSYLNPATCFDMAPVMGEWLFCFTVVFGFFVMFVLFFIEEYISPKKKEKKVAAVDTKKSE